MILLFNAQLNPAGADWFHDAVASKATYTPSPQQSPQLYLLYLYNTSVCQVLPIDIIIYRYNGSHKCNPSTIATILFTCGSLLSYAIK